MKSEEFVEIIKSIAPDISFLKGKYSDSFINETINEYIINEKGNEKRYKDELLNLIYCYDASSLFIGGVHFFKVFEEDTQYLYLGENESDALVMDKTSNEVKLLDHEVKGRIISECAKNGSSFLDALIEAKRFFTSRAFDESFNDEQENTCAKAFQCASLAGGEKYLDFYKVLLGCWS